MSALQIVGKKVSRMLDRRLVGVYQGSYFGLMVLSILIFISSMGVIYSKHVSRQLFAQLQSLQNKRDELHVEWSQLLLEQGTWATDVRVERVAREHLNMLVPSPGTVVVLRATANEHTKDR